MKCQPGKFLDHEPIACLENFLASYSLSPNFGLRFEHFSALVRKLGRFCCKLAHLFADKMEEHCMLSGVYWPGLHGRIGQESYEAV